MLIVAAVFLLPAERLSLGYDWFQNWKFHKQFLRDSVLGEGTVPLWCRWSFSGMPFLANPQTMLFYPGTVLYVLLPGRAALVLDVLVHFALAGVGMLLFCRARGLLWRASLFGAVAYVGCGFNLAHTTVGHIHYFAAVAWLPLVFLCVERWVSGGPPGWIAAGAGALAVQFFAGALPVSWMTMVFAGLYGLARLAEDWRGGPEAAAVPAEGEPARRRHPLAAAAGLAALFGLGLLLSSAQILPTRELAGQSLREGRGYEFTASDALPPEEAPHLLAPARLAARRGAPHWEFYGYPGLATLVLAGAAVGAGRLRRGGWALAGLALLAGVMMLGDATPAFRILYHVVPGLSLFRAHAREVLVLDFCLAALAAGALHALFCPDGRGLRPRRARMIAAGVVGTAALALGLTAGGPSRGAAELLWLAAAAGSALVAGGAVPAGRLAAMALTGLLALDLVAAERIVRDRLSIPATVPSAQEELAGVLRADEGHYRFWFPRRFFMSNQGYAERRSAVEGYENMILRRYQSYIHGMTGAPVKPDVITILTQTNFDRAPSPFPFAGLNVKYAAMPSGPGGSGYTLHTNPAPCGAAFLVDRIEVLPEEEILERMRSPGFDVRRTALLEQPLEGGPLPEDGGDGPAGEASIVRMTPNRILLAVEARREALLVLSEIHFPGWRVSVDGTPRPLLRANYILRAVRVPAGRHEVEFSFRPAPLPAGLGLSGAGLAICVALALIGRRRGRRGGAGSPPGPAAEPPGAGGAPAG